MPPKKRSAASNPVSDSVSPKPLSDATIAAEPSPAAGDRTSAKKVVKRAPTTRRTKTAKVAPTPLVVSEEQIRERAFYLSLEREGPRDPIADWFEAERSLRVQLA